MRPPPPLFLAPSTDRAWLIAAGEIDMVTAPRLATELAGGSYEGVDLAAVTFLDVSGLHVLLQAARAARAAGRVFAVASPSPMIRRLLELTAIDQSVDIVAPPSSAAASL
jgi:stage II sporulation protein AA (anti-sigma F factor antagonist)